MSDEIQHRDDLVAAAHMVHARGLSHGTTGNISCRSGEHLLVTPTNSSMADVAAEQLALVDLSGVALTDRKPSKEAPLHAAIYRRRPDVHAIVHTHSLHATAVACLANIDTDDALPALTAYYAMRVDRLPVVGFFPPGDHGLADAVGEFAAQSTTLLLRNHGVVVGADNLSRAVDIAEEIEQTARLHLLLTGQEPALLSDAQRDALRSRNPMRRKETP